MEFLNQFSVAKAQLVDFAAQLQTFEAPVPDYTIILGFLALLFAHSWAQRRNLAKVRQVFEDAYRPVLLNANRRAYQARAELRKAELELEHERQRRRREKRRADKTAAKAMDEMAELRPVDTIAEQKAKIGDIAAVVKLTKQYNSINVNHGVDQ